MSDTPSNDSFSNVTALNGSALKGAALDSAAANGAAGNGAAANGNTANEGDASASPMTEGVQLTINAQYLRDMSFENPRAPESLLNQQATPPEVAINVDVRGRSLGPDVYEVVLDLKAETRVNKEVAFIVEVEYAAVVTIRNAPQELVSALILVETPRLLFPFARAILADATRDGGFAPLLINPIDFAELHRQRAASGAANETSPNA